MSIPNLNNQIPLAQYNASSGQTEFSIAFYIFDLNDVLVYVNNVLKTIVVDYTIKKNDGTAISSTDLPLGGAKLVFNTGQTEGAKISINRDIPISRFTQFTTGGAFFADAFNTELTRILAIQQQLSRDINRSLRLSPSDAEGGSLEMPTGRANSMLGFNNLGNLILTKLADIDKANVSPFIATLLDDVTAQAARTTLDAQQLNANLSALANLTGALNKLPYFTGAGEMAVKDLLATTTNQGIIEIATDAEVKAATDTERAIVPSALASLFTASSRASSGYARIPVKVSGAFVEIIIQWAVGSFSAAGTANSFPIAFPNAVLGVYLGNIDTVSTIFGTGGVNLSGFTGSKNGSGATTTYYLAVGY